MLGVGGVLLLAHHGEVVVDGALVDGGGGLGDQLGAEHAAAVPLRGLVDGDLGALRGGRVGGVLEVGADVDVVGLLAGTVDVVLVGALLVRPRPRRQLASSVGREAAIPEDLARADGGGEKSDRVDGTHFGKEWLGFFSRSTQERWLKEWKGTRSTRWKRMTWRTKVYPKQETGTAGWRRERRTKQWQAKPVGICMELAYSRLIVSPSLSVPLSPHKRVSIAYNPIYSPR